MNKMRRLAAAVEEAEEAFWKTMIEHYPEVTTGDMMPPDAVYFSLSCRNAAGHWVDMNQPHQVDTSRELAAVDG